MRTALIATACALIGALGATIVIRNTTSKETESRKRDEPHVEQPLPSDSAKLEQPKAKPAEVTLTDEQIALKELNELIERSNVQALALRKEMERMAVAPMTLAMYDQVIRYLREGNAQGADASFRSDQGLMDTLDGHYRLLRVAYLEKIPQAKQRHLAILRAIEENKRASDPEYQALVEKKRMEDEKAKKERLEKRAEMKGQAEVQRQREINAIRAIMQGTDIPETHPLSAGLSLYNDAIAKRTKDTEAAAHNKMSDEAFNAFHKDLIGVYTQMTSSGVTTWCVRAESWNPKHERKTNDYTVDFSVCPPASTVAWARIPGIGDGIWEQASNEIMMSAPSALAYGALVTDINQGDIAETGIAWWNAYRVTQQTGRIVPVKASITFAPSENDAIARLPKSSRDIGMYILEVNAEYVWAPDDSYWNARFRPSHPTEATNHFGLTIKASSSKLLKAFAVERKGAIVAEPSGP